MALRTFVLSVDAVDVNVLLQAHDLLKELPANRTVVGILREDNE